VDYQAEIDTLFRGKNRELAPQMVKLVYDFRRYWPMTLRAYYYQAVSALLVPNSQNEYRRIMKLMRELRRAEILPWSCMEDKTRSTSSKRGEESVAGYIESEMEYFLSPHGYGRCYVQDQDVYLEITVEKDALVDHVQDAAYRFCTRVNVTKGQPSATMVNDIADRMEQAHYNGKKPMIIHLGDLDASGVQIPLSLKEGLADHHGIEVEVIQAGLTPEQCIEHDLPQSLDAAKKDDPNYRRWIDRYGDQAPTELDALHPEKLRALVRQSLESIYDLGRFDEQQKLEIAEKDLLEDMRAEVLEFLTERYPEHTQNVRF